MNPVYELVKNANVQLGEAYTEISLLTQQYSDDPQIADYIQARLAKLITRSNTLLSNIHTYMSDFASQSPAITIDNSNSANVIFSMDPKYLACLKTYSANDLLTLWDMLNNCLDNNMVQAVIMAWCDL